MKTDFSTFCHSVILVLAVSGLISVNIACGQSSASRKALPRILIQLEYDAPMIADQDTTPLLRVYVNGQVLVHYPDYTVRAGDYGVQLNEKELAEIRGWMKASDLGSSLQDSIITQKQIAMLARKSAGVKPTAMRRVLDGATTVIKYRRASVGDVDFLMPAKISWYDLQNEASHYPEVTALVKLAELEKKLLTLTKRNDLRQVVK